MAYSNGATIEWSTDGGITWHHGRSVEGWVANTPDVLASQRAIVRHQVSDGGAGVKTRVLEDES